MPQNPPSRRGPWTNQEDNRLRSLIGSKPTPNWVEIAQGLSGRSPKQCRERYHQNLKPGLEQKPISEEEGDFINRMVEIKGRRWAEIARMMRGRSDNSIKNWWNGSQNRKQRLREKSAHDITIPTPSVNSRPHSQPLADVSQYPVRWSQAQACYHRPQTQGQLGYQSDYSMTNSSTQSPHLPPRLPPSPDLPQQPRSRYHAGGVIEDPLPSPASSHGLFELGSTSPHCHSPTSQAQALSHHHSIYSSSHSAYDPRQDHGSHRGLDSRILPPLSLRGDSHIRPSSSTHLSTGSFPPSILEPAVAASVSRRSQDVTRSSTENDSLKRGNEIMKLSSLLL